MTFYFTSHPLFERPGEDLRTVTPARRRELDTGLWQVRQEGTPAEKELARSRLVLLHMRLVESVVYKRFRAVPGTAGHHLEFEDLIVEGAIGLSHAVEKFDPTKGWRFSTYAVYWIVQTVQRAIAIQEDQIKLPDRVFQERAMARSRGEVMEDLPQIVMSIDDPLPQGDTDRNREFFEKFFHDPQTSEEIEIRLSTRARQELLEHALDSIPPREAKIIRLCFGLGTLGEGHTYMEVGEMMGLSRERVRQLRNEGLKKLKQALFLFDGDLTSQDDFEKENR